MPTRLRFGPFGQFLLHAGGADEAAFGAAALGDRPHEVGFHGAGGFVNIMAIEAEARFEAKRIAGAEANGFHAHIGKQQIPQLHHVLVRDGNLEAVLAGVAGARDMGFDAIELKAFIVHELDVARGGVQLRQNVLGLRALQRHQRHGFAWLECDAAGQMAGNPVVVVMLAAGVHHHIEPTLIALVVGAGDHQVVENAAILGQKLRIALLLRRQAPDVGGDDLLHRCGCGLEVRPHHEALAHVRDVEKPGVGSGPVMFGENAGGILHRHVVACEGHHAGAELHVLVVEGGALGWFRSSRSPDKDRRSPTCIEPAPSVRDLRDFVAGHSDTRHFAPSVSCPNGPLLSRVHYTSGPFA